LIELASMRALTTSAPGPCSDEIREAGSANVKIEAATFRAQEPLTRCRNCSALARPNILMFDDWKWHTSRSDALRRDNPGAEQFAGARAVEAEVTRGQLLIDAGVGN